MPKEVRDSILEGIALNAMQRAEIIESIVKDPRNTFTNESLMSKSTAELKALSAFVKPLAVAEEKPAGQFFGMRVGPAANDKTPDQPEPLVVPDLAEAFKSNLKR
jgi:hypothetical protein